MYVLIALQLHTDYSHSANVDNADDEDDDAKSTHIAKQFGSQPQSESQSHSTGAISFNRASFLSLFLSFLLILVLVEIFGELVSSVTRIELLNWFQSSGSKSTNDNLTNKQKNQ